jgi:copper chaperone CopZ
MTCSHCAQSVNAEVSQLPGVTDVNVDLGSGKLTVASEPPVDETQVREAVAEAGYEVERLDR